MVFHLPPARGRNPLLTRSGAIERAQPSTAQLPKGKKWVPGTTAELAERLLEKRLARFARAENPLTPEGARSTRPLSGEDMDKLRAPGDRAILVQKGEPKDRTVF